MQLPFYVINYLETILAGLVSPLGALYFLSEGAKDIYRGYLNCFRQRQDKELVFIQYIAAILL